MRKLYLAGWVFVFLTAWMGARGAPPALTSAPGGTHPTTPPFTPRGDAARWFSAIRPHCNPVEVETRHRWRAPPQTFDGAAYSAACWALAGRVDRAREIIDRLDASRRWQAAGIVFNLAHPVADAGDDRAAGPIMEMVVEYWPDHYMALYHAGMARYGLGDRDAARDYLERFLDRYDAPDGWTSSARATLAELGG